MAIPSERKRLVDPKPSIEFLPPLAPGEPQDAPAADGLPADISESVLRSLPNDLTRMIYLASLRDCNSGLYLHPELSRQKGTQVADRALRVCHEQVFRRLLTTPLSDYVSQLQDYIRYTRSETVTVLKTWRSLEAYRATVPVGALLVSSALFFLNISIALEILVKQIPGFEQSH
jgi:hypothetical protein